MTHYGKEWEAHLRARGMLPKETPPSDGTKPNVRTLEGEYRGVPFLIHSLEYHCGEAGSLVLYRGKVFGNGFPSLEAGERRVRMELDLLAIKMAAFGGMKV